MRNSTAILATVALGAVLAIGSVTASTARDAGNGGHSGGHGRGFGGDHGYGATVPFVTNNGGGVSGDHGFSFRHGLGGSRHFGGFRGRDSGSPYAFDLGNSYARQPRNNSYAWGPLFGFDPYQGY